MLGGMVDCGTEVSRRGLNVVRVHASMRYVVGLVCITMSWRVQVVGFRLVVNHYISTAERVAVVRAYMIFATSSES